MIFTIDKNMYKIEKDYTVKSIFDEIVCKIAKVQKGYYIYNKLGNQLAQVTFHKDASARISLIKTSPSYPATVEIRMINPNEFMFSGNVLFEKEDIQYVEKIQGTNESIKEYSLWGKPYEYNYDIYDSNVLIASVISNPKNPNEYKIKTTPDSNILCILMICIAIEKLIADPRAKY